MLERIPNPNGFDRVGSLFIPQRKMPVPTANRRVGIIRSRDSLLGSPPSFNIVPNFSFETSGGGNAGLASWDSSTGQAHQFNAGAGAHSGSNVLNVPCDAIHQGFATFTSPSLSNVAGYTASTKVWSLWFQQFAGTPIDPASATIAVFALIQLRTPGDVFVVEARYIIAGNNASFQFNDATHVTTTANRVTPIVGTWQHLSLDLSILDAKLVSSGHTIADIGLVYLDLEVHGNGATFTIWWDDLWIGQGTPP